MIPADLQTEAAFTEFKLIAEEVQGKTGVGLTHNKNMLHGQKWQTMNEARLDGKTAKGYLLFPFCLGFT